MKSSVVSKMAEVARESNVFRLARYNVHLIDLGLDSPTGNGSNVSISDSAHTKASLGEVRSFAPPHRILPAATGNSDAHSQVSGDVITRLERMRGLNLLKCILSSFKSRRGYTGLTSVILNVL